MTDAEDAIDDVVDIGDGWVGKLWRISLLIITFELHGLNYSKSSALSKHETLKSTLRNRSLKTSPFAFSGKTKTGLDNRKRQHRIGICFTDVFYDLDLRIIN